jgi:hypothetical protein
MTTFLKLNRKFLIGKAWAGKNSSSHELNSFVSFSPREGFQIKFMVLDLSSICCWCCVL